MSARHEIVAAARRMRDLGLVTHTVGNVSARLGAGMLITPTRVSPYALDPFQIVELSLDGCGAGTPSLEWPLHAAIYRARPDVHAIVHTHSPYATARSFDPAPLTVDTEERVYLGIDRIEVTAPAPAGSEDLGRGAVQALGPRSAALLARHGVVGVGSDPAEALEICCMVEHQALIAEVIARRELWSSPSHSHSSQHGSARHSDGQSPADG